MMPDFGSRWMNPTLLKPGGQAITYLVEDAQTDGKPTCVAKILNNPRPERRARFLQEIRSTEEFDHPNVVKSIAQGETKNHKQPFFVMPYYEKGTLEENHGRLGSPLDRLRLFVQICEGVAYAHGKGLIHRDLKPANIFLSQETIPIVGDFGLCYRHDLESDERITQTHEAVGARKYIPPEWREGKVDNPQPGGDLYSLGKILYWVLVGTEYDGHEDDHQSQARCIVKTFWTPADERTSHQVARSYFEKWVLAFSLADEIVGVTLRKNPNERLDSARKLIDRVRGAIARIEAGGCVLNLDLPKRCLFCGTGTYQSAHRLTLRNGSTTFFPDRHGREKLRGSISPAQELYDMRKLAEAHFGLTASWGIPLILVCDFCGNVQSFRLDLTSDGTGTNWLP
jgi:serine/threonine protein kinase